MARAASSASFSAASILPVLGLTSTASRVAAGTSSRRSSSRFATNSALRKLIPVRLPPGRARLATKPTLTGSSLMAKTIGIVVVTALAAKTAAGPPRAAYCDLPANQVGRQFRQPIDLMFGPAIDDRHVLAFGIARALQAAVKSAQAVQGCLSRDSVEKSNHRHRRLLRAHHERPCASCAAEQSDELASS